MPYALAGNKAPDTPSPSLGDLHGTKEKSPEAEEDAPWRTRLDDDWWSKLQPPLMSDYFTGKVPKKAQ